MLCRPYEDFYFQWLCELIKILVLQLCSRGFPSHHYMLSIREQSKQCLQITLQQLRSISIGDDLLIFGLRILGSETSLREC